MTSIIVDNWTLQRAADGLDSLANGQETTPEYVRLMEAFVLWDKVYYFENEYSEYWKKKINGYGYYDILHTLDELCSDVERYKIITEHAKYLSFLIPDMIGRGAVEYQSLANEFGLNYLPSEERAAYLFEQESAYRIINRQDILKYYNHEIVEYYEEINKKIDNKKLRFSFPILYRYMNHDTKRPVSVKEIIQLKQNVDVKNFCRNMDYMEAEVNSGNIEEFNRYLNEIPKIISSMKRTFQLQLNGSFQISISPSGITITTPKLSISKSIQIEKRLQLTFLRKLAEYATKGKR